MHTNAIVLSLHRDSLMRNMSAPDNKLHTMYLHKFAVRPMNVDVSVKSDKISLKIQGLNLNVQSSQFRSKVIYLLAELLNIYYRHHLNLRT